jgi:ribose/xylose/arabinose/galactoside ABC-type transport system permease subunit
MNNNFRKYIPSLLNNLIWILLLGTIVLFSILSDRYLTQTNIINILVHASVLGIMVIGQAFTMLTGNFDLSAESTLGLCALAGAWLITAAGEPAHGSGLELSPIIAVPISVFIGLAIGWLNGFLITRMKMNNFIVTLAMLIVLRGLIFVWTEGLTVSQLPDSYRALGRARLGDIPVNIIVLILAFALAFLFTRYTRFGRDLYAVGGNRDAALASGIDPQRRIRQAYLLSGLMAAFAGWMLAGRLGVVVAGLGEGMIFEIQAAAVIGGVSLFGGRGTMLGALGGVLLLSAIDSGLNLMRVSAFWIDTVRGVIILLAMVIDAQKVRYSTPTMVSAAKVTAATQPAMTGD